jgi:hypothetical protein
MQFIQSSSAADARLRFVFNDAVMSFDLATNPTLEDIARKLGEPALGRHGTPVAIDVAWATPSSSMLNHRL